jgi:GNAT superfamily N-acetyltransferase
MEAVARLARELAFHVADPDPGAGTADLLKLGFGEGNWFDCLVAETDTCIVGFALYCKRFEAHTRSRKLWLADLVVSEQHRGRGVGRLLMEALKQRANRLGCDGIALELWAENKSALAFYEKVGALRANMLEVRVIPVDRPVIGGPAESRR